MQVTRIALALTKVLSRSWGHEWRDPAGLPAAVLADLCFGPAAICDLLFEVILSPSVHQTKIPNFCDVPVPLSKKSYDERQLTHQLSQSLKGTASAHSIFNPFKHLKFIRL